MGGEERIRSLCSYICLVSLYLIYLSQMKKGVRALQFACLSLSFMIFRTMESNTKMTKKESTSSFTSPFLIILIISFSFMVHAAFAPRAQKQISFSFPLYYFLSKSLCLSTFKGPGDIKSLWGPGCFQPEHVAAVLYS